MHRVPRSFTGQKKCLPPIVVKNSCYPIFELEKVLAPNFRLIMNNNEIMKLLEFQVRARISILWGFNDYLVYSMKQVLEISVADKQLGCL